MAKQQSVNEIVQLLEDAQQNKELVEAMAASLEKFVTNQKQVLNDLEVLIANARAGKAPVVKKRGGYRGRKPKPQAEG